MIAHVEVPIALKMEGMKYENDGLGRRPSQGLRATWVPEMSGLLFQPQN